MSAISTTHLPPTPPSEHICDSMAMDHSADSIERKAMSTEKAAQRHIWVITGPAGCGKTSVAEYLHSAFDFPYLEGDKFHTPENVKKMAEGIPLTDADRWDWLILLREEALQTLQNNSVSGVIVTCSALKRKYRDVLRIASYHNPAVRVHFVFLSASEAMLKDRVRARRDHYMKDYMVHSQFQSLEPPQHDETDILRVDASGTCVEVQELALKIVKETMEQRSCDSY
ncbi:hypothetical protein M433DRAFT_75765 [Acidomyces richmondensis BFW]|nr:MAG: hypothetical protein FE78DRAFT_28526 [Acidomyces sp. 'richmondensis']KYG41474.1 hypothetical protein M433DRAFT_75765 [Acidomyces richmondensis BFW]